MCSLHASESDGLRWTWPLTCESLSPPWPLDTVSYITVWDKIDLHGLKGRRFTLNALNVRVTFTTIEFWTTAHRSLECGRVVLRCSALMLPGIALPQGNGGC